MGCEKYRCDDKLKTEFIRFTRYAFATRNVFINIQIQSTSKFKRRFTFDRIESIKQKPTPKQEEQSLGWREFCLKSKSSCGHGSSVEHTHTQTQTQSFLLLLLFVLIQCIKDS